MPRSPVPIIADIHFQYKLALAAMEAGVAGLRLNPGNIRKADHIRTVAREAKDRGVPIRIGVNGGSLDPALYEKFGGATPEALVASAAHELALFEEVGFSDVKISVKASSVPLMIDAYRLLADTVDHPLHLGVTEAGPPPQGLIKSVAGIGTLLAEGIGDTIRFSLTADPVEEARAGRKLLEVLGLRERKGLDLIACPSCGRAEVDVIRVAREAEAALAERNIPLQVAVMGCVVNGPGEAREADLGHRRRAGQGPPLRAGQGRAGGPRGADGRGPRRGGGADHGRGHRGPPGRRRRRCGGRGRGDEGRPHGRAGRRRQRRRRPHREDQGYRRVGSHPMRMSQLFLRTLRDDPSDAEVDSHRLLVRAGFIRKVAAGVYSWLPLGYRVLRKVEQIVREEMDDAGAQELLLPIVQPLELWERTGRDKAYGPLMFRLNDRKETGFALAPTAEEVITVTVSNEYGSYRDLPVNVYQINWKYRDELRPRFGLLRSREFLMKDAYSFDADIEGLKASYKLMYDAYHRVFERCGLSFRPVEAQAGEIGGDVNHEFMAVAAVGEDDFVWCRGCDYAANVEAAVRQSSAAVSAPTTPPTFRRWRRSTRPTFRASRAWPSSSASSRTRC